MILKHFFRSQGEHPFNVLMKLGDGLALLKINLHDSAALSTSVIFIQSLRPTLVCG